MKNKFLLSLPLVGCIAFASCYQLPDKPRHSRPPTKQQTVTSEEQQKIQAQRELKEKEEKEKLEATTDVPPEPPEITAPSNPDKDGVKKRDEYAFANPVPGKEGFVFSPYNNKLVDVRDIPSGTLVQDPTYPASEKKYFRVP